MNKELIKSISEHLNARPEAVKSWIESNEIDVYRYSHLIVKPENVFLIIEDIINNNTSNLDKIIELYEQSKKQSYV